MEKVRTQRDMLVEKYNALSDEDREKLLFIAEGMRMAAAAGQRVKVALEKETSV